MTTIGISTVTEVPGAPGYWTDGDGNFWEARSASDPVSVSTISGMGNDGQSVFFDSVDGPPQSEADQQAEGDLGGSESFSYGPWTGTGIDAAGQVDEGPYPTLEIEGADMDGFAAQWDQVINTFDPLYRALADASAALSAMLAFPWEGEAGEKTRDAARVLKEAIDSLLAVGKENGLADLLNTAHAQKADWQSQSKDFTELQIKSMILFVVGLIVSFLPIPIAGLVGGIGKAVTGAIRAIGLAEAGSTVAGAVGKILPASLVRGVGAVTGSRTGSIVTETIVIGSVEYVISVTFESIYRKLLYEDYGLDPNYGEGATLALGAPIGAAVWLTRLPKRFDRAFTDNPVLRDIGLGMLGGFGAPAGFAIAFGEVEPILWAGIAAGGVAGAIGAATRRFDQRWNAARHSEKWRRKMRDGLEAEGIPGFTNQLFDGMIPSSLGSSLNGTQRGVGRELEQARSLERGFVARRNSAATARQTHWEADGLSNRAGELRQEAKRIENTDPEGAAVAITAARKLDQQAAAKRTEARALNDTGDSAQAQKAFDTAAGSAGDATLKRQVWEVIDKKGVDYFYTLMSQSRRLGYAFEAAYQIPISVGTKAWAKVLMTMVLGETPAELLRDQAAAKFEEEYGEVPDIDPALLEEAGLSVVANETDNGSSTGTGTGPGTDTGTGTGTDAGTGTGTGTDTGTGTGTDTGTGTGMDTGTDTGSDSETIGDDEPVGEGGDENLVEIQTNLRSVGTDLSVLADRVNGLLAQTEVDPVLTTIQKVYLADLRDRLTSLQADVTGAQSNLAAGESVTVGEANGYSTGADELRSEVDGIAAELVPA